MNNNYQNHGNGLGTDGTAFPYHPDPAPHAEMTFNELADLSENHGYHPTRPLDFPHPFVGKGVRVKVLGFNPVTGERKVLTDVIHREEFLPEGGGRRHPSSRDLPIPPTTPRVGHIKSPGTPSAAPLSPSPPPPPPPPAYDSYIAYWPQRKLQDAIYGCVEAGVVLIRHVGDAADDAARAAGFEPGHPLAPVVWEITNRFVAIKKVEWRKVTALKGRVLEDPVKEIAAMQLIGNEHPNVLGSLEVLQDREYLYGIMPYCRGGDLFGVVLAVAEERQENEAAEGAGGMSEPAARYWFRQLLFGLHHLQTKGICHRDLSLENMLVDINHCLIIDMGMCLRVPYFDPQNPGASADVTRGTVRRLLKPQGTCGKNNYMSPEIYANTDYFDGFAIDLWAAVRKTHHSIVDLVISTTFNTPAEFKSDSIDSPFFVLSVILLIPLRG